MLLWLLAGYDHSTGCTTAVVRARTTAAGYDGNDDSEEDSRAENSICNSCAAPTTVWGTNSPTTIPSSIKLVVGRTITRGRTSDAFAFTAFLSRSTLVVVRAGTRRRTTDAFAITVILATVTLVVVCAGTRRRTTDAFAFTALLPHWKRTKQEQEEKLLIHMLLQHRSFNPH